MASVAKGVWGLLGAVALMAVMILEWSWLQRATLHPATSFMLIVGGILLIFPTALVARRALERAPARSRWITQVLHVIVIVLLGNAIVAAVKTGAAWPGPALPFPRVLSLPLLWITGVAAVLAVVNLAVMGLGAPFAPALSQRLATGWMYRWTRNPMGLGTLAFLAALGLWFQSLLFVAWAVLLVTPAWLYFVVVYEERELELRFGEAYREYRARTPLFIPGRRGRAATARGDEATPPPPGPGGERDTGSPHALAGRP